MGVKYVIDNETMTDIADPLRSLTGRTDELTPAEMAAAGAAANAEVQTQADLIAQIGAALEGKAIGGGGAAPVIEPLEVTENGTYTVPNGVDGYSPVVVSVPIPDGYIKPSGTFPVTKNGEYDVTEYAEVNVEIPSSGGFVVKSGTTTSGTINTGLSGIEQFFIYKETVTATGLIHLHYSKAGGTSYLYASAWSTQGWGTKTVANGTNAATVNGGSITLPSNSATSGGLSSGVTYKWVAVGTE